MLLAMVSFWFWFILGHQKKNHRNLNKRSLLNRADEQMGILDLTRLYQPEIDALIHKLLELEEINLDVAENITDIGVLALLNIIGGR